MILTGENANFLEGLYKKFCENDQLVTPEWKHYFTHLENGNGYLKQDTNGSGMASHSSLFVNSQQHSKYKEIGVQSLIESYRRFGNLAAHLDPLNLRENNRELLELSLYGLEERDRERTFPTPFSDLSKAKLKDIIKKLEVCYCSSIGIEYAYVRNTQERDWLERHVESEEYSANLKLSTRLRLYQKLVQAETFEKFLAQKYIAKKRFSLEGCESFVPLLDTAIEEGAILGVECMVIGMAHRGRLNVLVNILQKPAGLIFAEFDENYDPKAMDYADVKYHLGYSHDCSTLSGKDVHLSLAFNPSHLEAVNPVVLGSIRARQAMYHDTARKVFMPILVHGDAAFMGQGVVPESLNLCNLSGYRVGGTLHILINNQIGFTTLPPESRSTEYATDIAKGFQIPILHVNADDPEAVYRATKLSLEYRQYFRKDVIIDLVGYRRLGHNETDEPAFTQPLMYDKIKKHPSAVQVYREKLLQYPDVEKKNIESIEEGCRKRLEETFTESREQKIRMKVDTMKGTWSSLSSNLEDDHAEPQKADVFSKQIQSTMQAITQVPKTFKIHPKIKRLLETRKKMFEGKLFVDWGMAEALAFGSILENKHHIRISGQDSKRGTFSHRHCALVDIKNGNEYIPLNHISSKQGQLEVCNSPLSEFSVLGFEYGYSLADPHTLVLWEAQFGDFANGAQIIFDQFISSSEVKWHRMSGLVVLLPHGYEGQGPEHSSARLERFLQLCANSNIQVCNCSTPVQYFHLLRRQILRKFRKPLIILTPKSLLRLQEAGSSISEFTKTTFQELLYNTDERSKVISSVKRLLFCSGKIYYELEAYRKEKNRNDVTIVRIEQLYPFPKEKFQTLLGLYSKAVEFLWVQEEPINQGAWNYLREPLGLLLKKDSELICIARQESSSPASGLLKLHQREQQDLLSRALS